MTKRLAGRQLDGKSVSRLSEKTAALARRRQPDPSALKGGTFTLTNHGGLLENPLLMLVPA